MSIINTKPQVKKLLVLIAITFILVATPMSGSANSTKPQVNNDNKIPHYIVESALRSSKQFDIPVENILGMILVENRQFNPKLVHYNANGTYDMGICQINSSNMKSFKSAGFTDVYNVDQNIAFGTMKLKFAKDEYGDNWHSIYMTYNMGGGGAKRMFRNKVYSTKYSKKALSYTQNIEQFLKEESKVLLYNKDVEYPLFMNGEVLPPYDESCLLLGELDNLDSIESLIPVTDSEPE